MATQSAQKPQHANTMTKASPDGFAVTSLVMGILTIVTCWLWPLALIFGVLGLIFGIISYNKSKHGMALAGIICSGAGLVLMIAFIIFIIAAADEITRNVYY